MKIGYARKSTSHQDVALQVDELKKRGCVEIYEDQVSRAGAKRKLKGTPELDNCLKALREGDTLIVWSLDRLGGTLSEIIGLLDNLKTRNITFVAIKDRIDTSDPILGEVYTHLMAIFSNFERNRIIERTHAGLAAARARGRTGGRKKSLDEQSIKEIKILLNDPSITVKSIAERYKVSRQTIYRYIAN